MLVIVSETIMRIAAIRIAATIALCVLAAAVASPTASAASQEKLFLKYYIHSGGLRVATLRFEIEFDRSDYTMKSSMKTKGLLDFVASSEFEASVAGQFDRFEPSPTRFNMVTDSWKNGKRTQKVVWNGERVPQVTRSWELGDFKTESLKRTIRANMPDPLSALLTASFQTGESVCRNKFRILDGKTVYDLVYSYKKRDDFDDDDPGVYRGEAHKCEISYRPVAGLSVKKLQKLEEREAEDGPASFTVWMAPVRARNIDRTVYVPVGGSAELRGRQTYAYLVSAALSGGALNERSSTTRD